MKWLLGLYRKLISRLPDEDLIEEKSNCVKRYNKAFLTKDNELLFLQIAREELEKRGCQDGNN